VLFRSIAALPDPLARTLAEWTRPNGLTIRRVAQPMGVIGMIYESRPNVGADAVAEPLLGVLEVRFFLGKSGASQKSEGKGGGEV